MFWVLRTSLHSCCLPGSQEACAVTPTSDPPSRTGEAEEPLVPFCFPTPQHPRLVEGKALSLEQLSGKKTTMVMGYSVETARLGLERRQEEPRRFTRQRSKRRFLPRAVRAALAKSSPTGSGEPAANEETQRAQRVSPAHPWAFPHPGFFAERGKGPPFPPTPSRRAPSWSVSARAHFQVAELSLG